MSYYFPYLIEQNLRSISERLKYLAANNNTYHKYIDPVVKGENLKLNLSLLLSHIILNLNFIKGQKTDLESVIANYNLANQTNISFDDYEMRCWIRIVDGELILSSVLRSYLWKFDYDQTQGKSTEIPEENYDLIKCIQIYYRQHIHDSKLVISGEVLKHILKAYTSDAVDITFLVSRNILKRDENENTYHWLRSEHARHLRNEIAATLWLLTSGQDQSFENFKIFVERIFRAEIFVDDLSDYLSNHQIVKIVEFSLSFLMREADLKKSDTEFLKINMDYYHSKQRPISNDVPDIRFNYSSPRQFFDDMTFYDWLFQDLFFYQPVRGIYDRAIHLILQNNAFTRPIPYQNVRALLKDTSRPYIIYRIFTDIPRQYPEIIPYLTTEPELLSMTFNLIDKIDIIPDLVGGKYGNDRKIQEVHELKNELYLELFDCVLLALANHNIDYDQAGKIIAEILLDNAENVFARNSNSADNSIKHDTYKSRYEKVIQKLKNKKAGSNASVDSTHIQPRLILFLLPEISKYLIAKAANPERNVNEFVSLPLPLIDLCIEILKVSNLPISELEITTDNVTEIRTASNDLTDLIKSCITDYFTADKVDVFDRLTGMLVKRAIHRGVNDYGVEIVDWGYVFLQFEKNNLMDAYVNEFNSSLSFNESEDKYDEQNREEIQKVRIYLKATLIGFVSIHQNKDVYEIQGMPVKNTLEKLEKQIKEMGLLYSFNDLANKRMDAFDESLSTINVNFYYQSLSSLLYNSINYFDRQDGVKFLTAYFEKSIDTGKMLAAINLINDVELKNIIAKRVEVVNIQEFIESKFGITELLYASIEAINSETHWNLAQPLMERLQRYLNKITHYDENTTNILFQIELLLAYKEKDYQKLLNIDIPKRPYQTAEMNLTEFHLKEFIKALYELNHNHNYTKAIEMLKSLTSKDEKNVRYAFQLYRAETLKAIS